MQEGFPFKKRLLDKGYSMNMGDDGRWLYVINGSTNRFDIFDGNLINAANVSGGAWIVNPFVKSITLTNGSNAIAYAAWYSAKYNSLFITRQTNAGGKITIYNTQTEAFTEHPFLVCYNGGTISYHDDYDIISFSNNNGGLDNFQRAIRPTLPTRQMVGYAAHKIIKGKFFQRVAGFINPETLLIDNPVGNSWMGDAIVYNGFILVTNYVNGANISIFREEIYNPYVNAQVGSIALTGHSTINFICLCTKEKKAYVTSTAATISIIDLRNMTSRGNVSGVTGGTSNTMYHEYSNTVISAIINSTRLRVVNCVNDTLLPDLTSSATLINNNTFISLLAANRTRFDG
jgi:hypothetical protein